MTTGSRRAAADRLRRVGTTAVFAGLASMMASATPRVSSSEDLAAAPCRQDASCPSTYDQAQLREKLFSIITSVRRKSDIRPRTVEKAMGRKMGPGQSRYVSASLVGKTMENKAYRIEIVGAPADRGLWVLLDASRYGAQDTCLLEFSRFYRDLTRLGYDASRMVDVHGPGARWLFVKRGVYIKASYKSTKYYARGEDIASSGLCIETLEVN